MTVAANIFSQDSAHGHSDLYIFASSSRPSLSPSVSPISRIEVEGIKTKIAERLVGNDVNAASLTATSSRGTLLSGGESEEGDTAVAALPSLAFDLNLVYELYKLSISFKERVR